MSSFDSSAIQKEIQSIIHRYRTTTGLEIIFNEVDNIPDAGNAVGELKFLPQACITLKKSLSPEESQQTSLHELLHLNLTMDGYPRLRVVSDNNGDASNLAAHLESLFQHRVIFEIEKRFSYDPLKQEKNAASSILDQLSNIESFGSPSDSLWHFRYCAWGAVFARIIVFLDGTDEFRSMQQALNNSNFSYSYSKAKEIAQVVTSSDLSSAKSYTVAVLKVLTEIVKSDRVVIASPIFPLDT